MVLNGVGGRTIREAKQNVSHAEALEWMKYMQLRGTLNVGLRIEVMLARLLVMTANANGIKKEGNKQFTIHDFAIHLDKPEFELTVDNVLTQLGGIAGK